MVLEFCSYWGARARWTSRQSDVYVVERMPCFFLTPHEEDLVFSEGDQVNKAKRREDTQAKHNAVSAGLSMRGRESVFFQPKAERVLKWQR
jgi:hypothetical protein